jgi:hypothetical protein
MLLPALSKYIQQFLLTVSFCGRHFTFANGTYGLMTAQNYLPVKK